MDKHFYDLVLDEEQAAFRDAVLDLRKVGDAE